LQRNHLWLECGTRTARQGKACNQHKTGKPHEDPLVWFESLIIRHIDDNMTKDCAPTQTRRRRHTQMLSIMIHYEKCRSTL